MGEMRDRSRTGAAGRVEILTRNPPAASVERGGLFVGSVAKALQVLRAFRGQDPWMSATQIARASGLGASGTQRFLHTLHVLGLVERERGGRRFRLSVQMLDFAYLFLRSDPLVTLSRPHLEHLAQESGELVNLAVLDRADVIYLHRVQGRTTRPLPAFVGGRMPSFLTSNGRVLLAALPPGHAQEIIAGADLRPLTPASITDPVRILERIETARRDGYALVDEESEAGALSIATPVVLDDGHAVAAVNIVVAKPGWTIEATRARLLPMLRETSAQIALALAGARV